MLQVATAEAKVEATAARETAARGTVPAPGQNAALDRLLAQARGFSVEFPAYLANHLPMALGILAALGAPPARLGAFFETYRDANGLVPPPAPQAPLTRDRWTEALGDRGREADARAFFAAETARLGLDGVQRAYLPRLLPGIAASALHAFMRLAYADLRGDPDEVGVALGAWTATFLPLGPADVGSDPEACSPAEQEPGAVLLRLRDDPAFGAIEAESDLLWHWMRATADVPAFARLAAGDIVGPGGLPAVARASLALYAGTMTFEALHAVTGAHWLRLIRPHDPDPRAALTSFWRAIAAVTPKIGRPALPEPEALDEMRRRPCPGWPEIRAAAIRSDDEHDLSLVFSAGQEMAAYGDPLYRYVAARRVGLVD